MIDTFQDDTPVCRSTFQQPGPSFYMALFFDDELISPMLTSEYKAPDIKKPLSQEARGARTDKGRGQSSQGMLLISPSDSQCVPVKVLSGSNLL